MKAGLKEAGRRVLEPVAAILDSARITPNQVTIAGLVLSLLAGAAVARGHFILTTVLLVAGSLCDVLDGSLARRSGRSTRFGAFLDSTMDRYAEMGLFLGLAVYFASLSDILFVAITFVAAAGSLLVSYARARAEGLGISCNVGLMERPERLVLLIAAAAFGPAAMKIALCVLAVLTHFTAFQRVRHVQVTLGRATE